MIIAVLYDIHGNLPALESVLSAVQETGAEKMVIGGDMLPGPFPQETVDLLHNQQIPVSFISGNGERETLDLLDGKESTVPESLREGMRWCGKQLSDNTLQWLRSLPAKLEINHPRHGQLLFCHATPRNDYEIFTCNTPEHQLVRLFPHDTADIYVCGHTHMPFCRNVGQTKIVNAGSVGMAFGSPHAQWLLIDDQIRPQSTPYDRQSAARRILKTSFPDGADFVSQYIRRYPSAEKMLELFDAAAINET